MHASCPLLLLPRRSSFDRYPFLRSYRQPPHDEPRPGWFAVALWPYWPSETFPRYEGYVQTPHAFHAVEAVMQYHRVAHVAYASARALDGSCIYRCVRPSILLESLPGWDEQSEEEEVAQ